MESSDDAIFLHSFSKISGVGAEKIRRILAHFGSAGSAWHAEREDFLAAKLSEKITDAIISERPKISPDHEQEELKNNDIRLIPPGDADYPALLSEIPNPPHLLYLRGNVRPNARPLITIVGTRKPTAYGAGIAREFARELGRSGITVVSGMALGIDREAHIGALDGESETIAVLGNGLDDGSIAPRAHLELAHAIVRRGALLSDYPPGTPASDFTFPARNRIMAGMSLGTVVVEASEKSGTLITARLALEYNRDVFAVPGSIYSEGSRGPHALIREGAVIATGLADILDALPLIRAREKETAPQKISDQETENLSPEESRLLKILGSDTMHIDTLVKRSTLGTASALSAISLLEMKGFVKNVGNMHYIRTYRMNSK